MSWFKFDSAFFSNRKVIRAGRNGRDVYQHVLCCNAQRNADGSVPVGDIEPWYAARQLGITVDEAKHGVTDAVTAGLLEIRGDMAVIVGWDPSWSTRRQSRADIQRNYRDRKNNGKETQPETQSSVTGAVTRYRECDALPDREIERERERGNAPDSLPAASPGISEFADEPRGGRARRGRAEPLAAVWEPDAASSEIARQLGLDTRREAARFRDHFASTGEKRADWQARFRKWLDDSKQHEARAKATRSPKPGATRLTPVVVEDDYGDPVTTKGETK